jgi:hypothetical protein
MHSPQPPRRTFTVRPQPQQLALEAARAREKTEAFKQQYAHRAGIEGTISLWVAVLTCAERVTWIWSKPISNMFWSLMRSISPVSPGGSMEKSLINRMPPLLRACFKLSRLRLWVRQQDHKLWLYLLAHPVRSDEPHLVVDGVRCALVAILALLFCSL